MELLRVTPSEIDPNDPNWEFVDVSDIVEANLCNFDDSELRELVKNIQDEMERRARNAAFERCEDDD